MCYNYLAFGGGKLRTLYIDIYFLINFTVDILSLYFATLFSKVPTTNRRLIISGILGAFFACGIVFLPDKIFYKLASSFISLLIIGFVATKRILLRRRFKFIFSFIIFEALFGGAVSFIFGILDKYLYGYLSDSEGGSVNRKILLFSLVILLSIGVFKMLVTFFSNAESEESCEVEIKFLNKKIRVEAFVDSGNLAFDPMDMHPVLLIKKDIAKELFPQSLLELNNIDLLDKEVQKRIRLIPISSGGITRVLTGVRVDSTRIVSGDKGEEICVTVAIDREGGNYGGFSALMPSAALKDVVI